jgi:hypothetical protein
VLRIAQLAIRREELAPTEVPGGLIMDKTISPSYWPDGNLRARRASPKGLGAAREFAPAVLLEGSGRTAGEARGLSDDPNAGRSDCRRWRCAGVGSDPEE